MRKLVFLIVAAVFLFSCQKRSDVTPVKEKLLDNSFTQTFKASLKTKISGQDFASIDFSTARHTSFAAQPDIVRVGFSGRSFANDFVLLETDKSGKISDGRIIHLNYLAEPDERSKKVRINGSMVRSSLDRSIVERFRIVNGGLKRDNPLLMEDESIPEVVVYAQYMENKIGFSTWYAFGNMGGLSSGYGGYGLSSDGGGSGSGSNSSNNDMKDEDPFDFYELKVDSTVKKNAKVNCVMNKLFAIGRDYKLKGFTVMQSLWVPFWSNSSDVVYIMDKTLPNDVSGKTTPVSNNGPFIVKINENIIAGRTPLLLAGTIVHETIHAYLMDKYKVYGQDNFYKLMGYQYMEISKDSEINFKKNQHQFMVQYYIPSIVKVLADFDKNSHDMEYYESIAWEGLMETPFWETVPDNLYNRVVHQLYLENKADKSCK